MYVYKISELLKSLSQAKEEGFDYVSLCVLEAEDDMPESVDLSYVHSSVFSSVDSIDAFILPKDYTTSF